MQLGMHTECIQNAYKHIKEKKREEFLFYFFFILPVLLSFTVRDLQTISSLLALSGMYGPIKPHCPFFWVTVAVALNGHGGLPAHATCMRCMHQKTDYACYAKTQLRN